MFLYFVKCLTCVLFVLLSIVSFSQDITWISGVWKGTGIVPGSLYTTNYIRTLNVDKVVNNRFVGKLVSEVKDGKGTRQDIAISGLYETGELKVVYGKVLYTKEPPFGQWWDCRTCKSTSQIKVSGDTILLTLTNIDCGETCNGESRYYKLLTDFDSAMQKKIISMFHYPLNTKDAVTIDSAASQLSRTNTIIATYKIFSPEIKLMLFDNGEIDQDIVSVYHNGKKIIDRAALSATPIVRILPASVKNRLHEFVLVAENLGDIPPNTAFMRIVSGEDQYELFAKTNLEENAVIKIEYAGK